MHPKWDIAFTLIVVVAVQVTSSAAPDKSAPAEETLSPRQQSLLLQLSDAEANIKALNLALVRTGYKVGVAYDRIDSGQRGNALMDRKAGGPVGWQDFYGKTARSFYIPDSEATLHSEGNGRRTDVHVTQGNRPIQRPTQFNYIYKANNDQIARAKEQVAVVAQDQAALLARRQKHESDQSRLWAQLAWERVKDREIADEPLCRFKLKGASGPDDARVQVLRALVLFLRTADKVAGDSLDSVEADQDSTFADLNPRMKAAYAALRTSLADGMLAADLQEETKNRAEAIKSLCKQLSEECSVIADNYHNALDRDKAREDNSKLVFRGKLQESLAMFASAVAELDVQLGQTARAWNVEPDKSTPTTDAVPTSARTSLTKTGKVPEPVARGNPLPVGVWIKLFEPPHLAEWSRANAVGSGQFDAQPLGQVTLNGSFTWGPPFHDAILRAKVHKLNGQNLSLNLRTTGDGGYGAWFNGGNDFGIGKRQDGKFSDLVRGRSKQRYAGSFTMEFSAIGDELTLKAEDIVVARCRDANLQLGVIAIGAFKGTSEFENVQLQILDKTPVGRP